MKTLAASLAISLLSTSAFATGVPVAPTPVSPNSVSSATALSDSSARSTSGATAQGVGNGYGGNAAGGAGGTSSASNNLTVSSPRFLAPAYAPTVIGSGCDTRVRSGGLSFFDIGGAFGWSENNEVCELRALGLNDAALARLCDSSAAVRRSALYTATPCPQDRPMVQVRQEVLLVPTPVAECPYAYSWGDPTPPGCPPAKPPKKKIVVVKKVTPPCDCIEKK